MKKSTIPKPPCSVCHREYQGNHRGMCANCYRIWQRENFPPNATCDVCGRAYFRRPCASKKGKTCSRECFSIWKKGKNSFNHPTDGGTLIERECPVCKTTFTTENRNINRGWGTYCSQQCNAIRKRKTPGRSMYPINAWRQRQGFTRLSAAILATPNVCCEICGAQRKSKRLVVHHLIDPGEDPYALLVSWNLQVLCRTCHMHVHARKF